MKRLARRYRYLLEDLNLQPMNGTEIAGFHIAFVGTIMWAVAAICAMLIALVVVSTIDQSPEHSQPFFDSSWRQTAARTLIQTAVPLGITGTAGMTAGILINKAGRKKFAAKQGVQR